MRRCLGTVFALVIGYAVPAGPAAQGQTGQIAFATNRATGGHDDVYVMNADGSAPIAKTSDASREERAPAWSADGTRIAFQSAIPNVTSFQIVVMNADGSGQTTLTNGDDSEPSWSPDGTRIAFTSFRSGSGDIYVMNADGTQQTQRTNDPATDSDPDWSPNGAQIVFVTKRDGGISHVYVMNADGTGAIRLTNTTMHDAMPEWSPDGTKIAFARLESGGYEIYVMNADGSGQTRLTNSSGHDLNPTWSPDGTMIAFSTVRDGNEEIYVMGATDGSNPTNVSNNPARDGYPAWKPQPVVDTDGDGTADSADTDDDNDNIPDVDDPFPLDRTNTHPVFLVDSQDDAGDAAPGNGVCATASGACTLRAAVQEANALAGPDRIEFTGTTITLTGTAGEDAGASGDLDVTVAGGPLTIVGNGAGNTIIQGCDADVDSDCVGIDRLFDVQDGASLTLSGVTLRNGSAGTGGAIRVGTLPPWASPGQATLVLDASEVLSNRSTGSGGGVYSTFGIVGVTDSVFANNEAVFHGGAIVNSLGTLTIDRSTIDGNRAATGEGATGGHGGGAIFNGASGPADVTISNSTISGNSGEVGGALYNNGFTNSQGLNGRYLISNTTISGNTATWRGGAIFNVNGAVTLASVTMAGNAAPQGAAILTLQIGTNSSVATTTVRSTIIADNGAGENCRAQADPGMSATITSAGYSLSDDATCAFGLPSDLNEVNAGLAPLANNGGPTLTHALLGFSPAIDAGDPVGCTDTAGASLSTDQRGEGFPRAIDGDGDNTPVCDIGAVEGVGVSADYDGDGVPDVSDAFPLDPDRSAVPDETTPTAVILSPTTDSVFITSPALVRVRASDNVTVVQVTVNGQAAVQVPGTTDEWEASVPISVALLNPPQGTVGTALNFVATAVDAAGNEGTSGTLVVDNDGIDAAIDLQPTLYSNDYQLDPATFGTIAHRAMVAGTGAPVWAFRLSPGPGSGRVRGVIEAGTGTGSLHIGACGGTLKQVRFDYNQAGESALWHCEGDTLHVTNTGTVPDNQPVRIYKVLPGGSFWSIEATIAPGDSAWAGSPVTADAGNNAPVLVTIFDENGVDAGGFALDAAEAVDIDVTIENGQPQVQLHLENPDGSVEVTVFGQTETLTASNPDGEFQFDVEPPAIAGMSVDRRILWPPNHQMVNVTLAYQVRDVVDPAPTCSVDVRSNEPINGTGDGDTAPDWQIVDAHRLLLRAERSGKGSGRVYTIEVTCTDASGNSSRAQTLVNVPKSQGR